MILVLTELWKMPVVVVSFGWRRLFLKLLKEEFKKGRNNILVDNLTLCGVK